VLDPAACVAEERNIQRPGEAAGDRALRFRDVRAIGVELVGPEMRAAFGISGGLTEHNIHAVALTILSGRLVRIGKT
jgi:hypothetical protein